MPPRVPQSGDPLSPQDVEVIFQAIMKRHNKFPDESMMMSAVIVMLNIGDRYAKVWCVDEENCGWGGEKQDLQPGEGIPRCPNGHPLYQDPGLKLTWMKDL